jgi:hypothetical protein
MLDPLSLRPSCLRGEEAEDAQRSLDANGHAPLTRLTNGFSKKVENHAAAVALYTMWPNFGRSHKSLENPYPRTPAMAAGIADHVWTCEEIAALLD